MQLHVEMWRHLWETLKAIMDWCWGPKKENNYGLQNENHKSVLSSFHNVYNHTMLKFTTDHH